jgi:hypothetical protein
MVAGMFLLPFQTAVQFLQLPIGYPFRRKPRSLSFDGEPCFKDHDEVFQNIAVYQFVETVTVEIELLPVVRLFDNLPAFGGNGPPLVSVLLDIAEHIELIEFAAYGGAAYFDPFIFEGVHDVPGTYRVFRPVYYFQDRQFPFVFSKIQNGLLRTSAG